MKRYLVALLVVVASAILQVLADAEKGPFEPPMRKEGDLFPAPATAYDARKLQMENLGRGVVAVRTGKDGKDIWVSWRYRSIDPMNICFNVYRDGEKVNSEPIADVTFFVDSNAWHGAAIEYEVVPVLSSQGSGVSGQSGATFHELKHGRGKWRVPSDAGIGYIDIPVTPPPEKQNPAGNHEMVGRHANDCSVGDVDGDGEYELFLKWESDWGADQLGGWAGETAFECLKIPSGESLWRIEMGPNMRAGQHYMPFVVADFDGDGKAELIMRTAPGTVDGALRVCKDDGTWEEGASFTDSRDAIGNPSLDKPAPEFLTVFDGNTGKALDTVRYDPPFVNPWIWGDWHKSIGNRSHRFLASTAYLDGVHPTAIMCRGYYNRTCLAAWDWDGKNLRERWFFDSEAARWRGKRFSCQGFHNLRVADIDFDGKDEIIYGQMVVDDDGTGVYSTGLGHGDQIHIVQSTPNHIGLQVWTCQEHGGEGVVLRDAKTGGIIFQQKHWSDVGNCLAAAVDPFYPGVEFYSASSMGAFDYNGRWLGAPRAKWMAGHIYRFAVWWMGDMSRSLMPGSDGVWDYSVRFRGTGQQQRFEGCEANNGSKGNPCLAADILGDWREEVLLRRSDNKAIRLYVSTFETPYRFWTFMEDPCYRNSVAAENAGYNVAPEPSFYFGPDLRGHGIFWRGGFIK